MKSHLDSGKQRARSPEEKTQRREQIITAAAELLDGRRFGDFTLTDVARRTGLSKAALYRYFRSRELLFLAVYRREYSALIGEVETLPPDAVFAELPEQLVGRPLFCQLTAILHVALETGLSESEARDFKQFLLDGTQRLSARLSTASDRSEADCFDYLMRCQQALIGCWHLGHPAEMADRVMRTPPLDRFRVAFAPALREHLAILTTDFLYGHA